MSLQCNVSLNVNTYTAGQSPSPNATVQVYNPNAVAVVVTGMRVFFYVLGSTQQATASSPAVPPTGAGQTVSVPALSSLYFGPFSVAVGSAANANPNLAMGPVGSTGPINPQLAHPMQYTLMVGAEVTGSDGSLNTATPAPLLVSYFSQPTQATAGGTLQLSTAANSAGIVPGWP